MHVEAALRAAEDEVLKFAFQIGLHLEELQAEHLGVGNQWVGPTVPDFDCLVDELLGLGSLLGDGVDGAFEDVAFTTSHGAGCQWGDGTPDTTKPIAPAIPSWFRCRVLSITCAVAMSLSIVSLVAGCTGNVAPVNAPTPGNTVVETAELPPPTWLAAYGNHEHEAMYVTDLVLSRDGESAFVSGDVAAGRPACPSDFVTVAYDTTDGTTRWAATYDGPAHFCDDVHATALSPDGSTLFVTGSAYGPSNAGGSDSDITTVAYDTSDGTELWVARQDGPISGQDNGVDVVSTGRMVFVTGDEMTGCDPGASSTCYSRMTTIAYDATSGKPRWLARYAVDGSSIFPGQILASAGGEEVFVIGIEQPRGTMTTIAYAASTGAERWVGHDRDLSATYVIGNQFADWAGISADGRTLFVAGSVGGFRHGVAAYATKDGVKLWTLETSRSSWSWPMIVPSPMSDIVFLADQNHDDYLITGIDAATGRELWRSTYDEAGRDDYPIEMAVPADGSRVFVTGFPAIYCPRCPASATIALDAVDGRRVWAHAAEYGAADIAAGADGSPVYLAATSRRGFLTFRFDPSAP